MANDFKRFVKASVNDSLGASATEVYAVPSTGSVAMESIVIGISLCNTTSSNVTANIFLDNYDATNDAYIARNISVPANTTLEIMQGNKIVLQGDGTNNDSLRVSCSATSSLDATVSVLEDV